MKLSQNDVRVPSSANCLFLILIAFALIATPAWARKSSKTVTAPNGQPVRKVYIRTATPDLANSAAIQLQQDTCLTTVTKPDQADAVLDLGIALPSIGGGLPQPNIFGSTAHAQTMGDPGKGPERSASANCTDSKGNSGCTGSYTAPAGDLAALPPTYLGSGNGNLDISLTSPSSTAQELWEPNVRSKKTWTDQLRVAAGCPVCPGEHFNRRKYHTYRNWIQTVCPNLGNASNP
jgi:hypothetical protein